MVSDNGDCAFNIEKCSVECSEEVQFYEVDDLERVSPEIEHHQNWQYNRSVRGEWYAVAPYESSNGLGTIQEVSGIGYGQLVWTVRRPSEEIELIDPGQLNVEVHTLPITGQEPGLDEFALVTIVPRANCQGDGCQIYEPNVKLVLSTDWFFSMTEDTATLYREEFLTSLQDTEKWCVGVNTTNNNNIEMGPCGSDGFLDDWFFDGITTRMHVANHPYMCPTLANISNTSTSAYETSLGRGGASSIYSNAHGNLLWSPCTPCTIGAERVLLPDTSTLSSQLFAFGDVSYYGDKIEHDGNTTFWDDAVYTVSTALPSNNGWLGFVFNSEFACATTDGTDLTWERCDPVIMLSRASRFCTSDPGSFTIGIFQYVCTQGQGGTVEHFTTNPPDCSDLGSGHLDGSFGYGASINADGSIIHGGIGYMNNERIIPTGSACEVIVATSKVCALPPPPPPRLERERERGRESTHCTIHFPHDRLGRADRFLFNLLPHRRSLTWRPPTSRWST